ncbi:hypothetical protein WJX77_010047 [Trebouxia sp. C0004]
MGQEGTCIDSQLLAQNAVSFQGDNCNRSQGDGCNIMHRAILHYDGSSGSSSNSGRAAAAVQNKAQHRVCPTTGCVSTGAPQDCFSESQVLTRDIALHAAADKEHQRLPLEGFSPCVVACKLRAQS